MVFSIVYLGTPGREIKSFMRRCTVQLNSKLVPQIRVLRHSDRPRRRYSRTLAPFADHGFVLASGQARNGTHANPS